MFLFLFKTYHIAITMRCNCPSKLLQKREPPMQLLFLWTTFLFFPNIQLFFLARSTSSKYFLFFHLRFYNNSFYKIRHFCNFLKRPNCQGYYYNGFFSQSEVLHFFKSYNRRAQKSIEEPLFQYSTEKKCFADNFLFSLLVVSLDFYLIIICYIYQLPTCDQKQETEPFREVPV